MRICVVLSTPGVASMKHLQFSLRIRTSIVAAHFFIEVILFFQACFSSTTANPEFYEANKLYFYPSAGGLKTKNEITKQKKTTAVRLIRVIRVHIHIHIYSTYIL